MLDNESLSQIERIVTSATNGLRQDMAAVGSRLGSERNAIATRLGERIEEAKRHTGVLVEGLRHDVQLIAKGFQMHLERCHAEDRAHLDEQFRETCD